MQQRYKSTRGGTAQDDYSFEDALFSGYAPDGGLFVPVSLPSISREKDQYSLWSNMTFPELAYDVLVSSSTYESYQRLFASLWRHTNYSDLSLLSAYALYTAEIHFADRN
jgi:threonine synthase